MYSGRAEDFSDQLRCDLELLFFAARHLRGDGAADGADLPLQFAHAGLAGVIFDHASERFICPNALLRLESVFLKLSRTR